MEEITLPEHEKHSQQRAEEIIHKIEGAATMGHDGVHDKVEIKNIFEPGHGEGGGMGGLGTAAAIAAMGNRNESGNGLAAMAPALMAAMGGQRHHDGFGAGGFGAGLVGGVLGGLLFGGRRGGLFGGEGGDGSGGAETRIEDTIFNTTTLAKLGTIEAAIPLAAAQTENVILQQTNQITNLSSQAQLANAMGFERTGDRVQNVGALLLGAINNTNQNVLEQGCQTRAVVLAAEGRIIAKLDQNTIDDLRHRADRAERAVEVNALRSQVEVNQTVTTTQAQAQGQFQVQSQFQALAEELRACRRDIAFVHQEARATNSNVIAGNTGAVTTGAQTASPTNVNTKG